MIFTRRLRDGVRKGEITCSVRIWMRPHVVVGHRYRMDEGEIEIDSLLPICLADVTPELARASGFRGLIDLIKVAKHGRGENVYLVRFHYVPPGPADEVPVRLPARRRSAHPEVRKAKPARTTARKQAGRRASQSKKAKSRGVTVEEAFKLASALPGVEVGTSWGTPGLKVKGRFLARLKEDGESLVLRLGLLEREALMARDPEVFYITDHYLNYPAVLARLPKIRKSGLQRVLTEAWRNVAPASLQSKPAAARRTVLTNRRKAR
jgi:hypothetical protein